MNQANSLIFVTTITLVHHDVLRLHIRKRHTLLNRPIQCVTIIRIPMERLHPNNPTALAGDHKTHLVAKFVFLVGLPLGNALHIRLVKAVKLRGCCFCLLQ